VNDGPTEEIKSRLYSNNCDTLAIWAAEKRSPAYARGAFTQNGNTGFGEWVYPGGGGYRFTMTRVI
jgi:hypothetical protein